MVGGVQSVEGPEQVGAGMDLNRRTIYRRLWPYHYGGEPALSTATWDRQAFGPVR